LACDGLHRLRASSEESFVLGCTVVSVWSDAVAPFVGYVAEIRAQMIYGRSMVVVTMNMHTPARLRRRSMLQAGLAVGFAPAGLQAATRTAGDASPVRSDEAGEVAPGPATPWRALMAPGWSSASYFRSLPAV
jgi:hypothetical protein